MEQRYLPSTPQQRLQDLMKEHKITQAVLAKKIGVTESTLSRFINGTKDTLSLDQMISIARIFNVSTDFLLCMTDVPDRKNYDISELGLSAEAARNLYTGRTNPQVVSRLLENRRFAQLTSVYVLKQQLRPSFIAILLEQGSQLNSNIIISISIQNTDADAFEKQIQIREIAG